MVRWCVRVCECATVQSCAFDGARETHGAKIRKSRVQLRTTLARTVAPSHRRTTHGFLSRFFTFVAVPKSPSDRALASADPGHRLSPPHAIAAHRLVLR